MSIINYLNHLSTNLSESEIIKRLSNIISPTSEYDELLNLLFGNQWPEAAPSFLICTNEQQDKMDRASTVLDYINIDLNGKKFLDFGCGDGHVVKQAAAKASLSMGFDLITSDDFAWETTQDNYTLTTDIQNLENKTFDIILLYDVLDHCSDPLYTLNYIYKLCHANTKVIVRCHPWTSRHATHLYKKINKAYIHLIFTEEELMQIGIKQDYLYKTYFPIKENLNWFKSSGFKVIQQEKIITEVEDFFLDNPVIMNRVKGSIYKEVPKWQMEQSFNDYVLQLS